MESALCPLLNNLHLTTTVAATTTAAAKTQFRALLRNQLSLVPPFSSCFPEKISNFHGKRQHLNPPLSSTSPSSHYLSDEENPSRELAVLLDVEG
ncbi:hypothetical protein TIFTF001_029375 [Ficus carica]|uniref:Uncharacterized protein n=1 Tax=Ficus carica TaxID=3494 RepID=A0AA88DSB8_FICCA|nr:hypothetical protein TIFTF001_029375 [Ficus carica]